MGKAPKWIRKKVYDPLLRTLHAVIGICVITLLATAWSAHFFEKGVLEKSFWQMHIGAGYILAGSLLLRLIWGLLGPESAKLRDLWHPRVWRLLVTKKYRARQAPEWGHDPKAAVAYLLVYGLLLGLVISGFALAAIDHAQGPLLEWLFDEVRWQDFFQTPHEIASYGVVAFILVHLGALIFHENHSGVPRAQAMISGYQYQKSEEELKNETSS